jgi:hypothetical protein
MPPVDRVSLPLEHHVPESVVTRLANHVTLQLDQDGCYLSFYEAVPPLLVGNREDVRNQLARVKSLRAECVARIFLPKTRMADFLNVLRTTLEHQPPVQPGHEPLAAPAREGNRP